MFSIFRRHDPDKIPPDIRALLLFLVQPLWSAQRQDWQAKGCPAGHAFKFTDRAFCWLMDLPAHFPPGKPSEDQKPSGNTVA